MMANSFRRIFTENLNECSKDSKVSILFRSEWYYKIYKITYREIENVNWSVLSISLETNQSFFKINHKEGMTDPKILKLIKPVSTIVRLTATIYLSIRGNYYLLCQISKKWCILRLTGIICKDSKESQI